MTVLDDDAGCYYGVHFGCLCAARDSNCRRCAEELTNAVNYELRTSVNKIDTPRTKNAYLDAAARYVRRR